MMHDRSQILAWIRSGLAGATLVLLVLTAGSGLLLLAYYRPSLEHAGASLLYLHRRVILGSALHSIHAWGAKLLLVAVGLHLIEAGFRRPLHPVRWLAGVGLAVGILLAYLTGHLLTGMAGGYGGFVRTMEILETFPGMRTFMHIVVGWHAGVTDTVFSRAVGYHTSVMWVLLGVLGVLHLQRWLENPRQRFTEPFWIRHAIGGTLLLGCLAALGFFFPPSMTPLQDPLRVEGQPLAPFWWLVPPSLPGIQTLFRLGVMGIGGLLFLLPWIPPRWQARVWIGVVFGWIGAFLVGWGGLR